MKPRLLLILVALVLMAAKLARAEVCPPLEDPELQCLSLNVYWEARARPLEAQRAVAHTTLNRVASADFPGTLCEVVQQGGEATRGGCQFHWWCDGKGDEPQDAAAWCEAVAVAQESAADPAADPTGGALYFHQHSLQPPWAAKLQRLGRIDNHVYYK